MIEYVRKQVEIAREYLSKIRGRADVRLATDCLNRAVDGLDQVAARCRDLETDARELADTVELLAHEASPIGESTMTTAKPTGLSAQERDQVAHFLRLAERGASPGASGGERRAARLLDALDDHLPGIDQDAYSGFLFVCAFIRKYPARNGEEFFEVYAR